VVCGEEGTEGSKASNDDCCAGLAFVWEARIKSGSKREKAEGRRLPVDISTAPQAKHHDGSVATDFAITKRTREATMMKTVIENKPIRPSFFQMETWRFQRRDIGMRMTSGVTCKESLAVRGE